MLARHSQLQYWCLVDALDWQLPQQGTLSITDGVETGSLTLNRKSTEKYQELFQQQILNVHQKIWQIGGDIHFIGSLPEALRKQLER